MDRIGFCTVRNPGPENGTVHFRYMAEGPEACTALMQTAAGPFVISACCIGKKNLVDGFVKIRQVFVHGYGRFK